MARALLSLLLLMYVGSTSVLAVTGGEPAKEGKFPFMVSIRDSRNCHICGGTIIGDRWVLTSNICYSRSWFGSVKFGTTKMSNNCGDLDSSDQIKTIDVLYNPWASDLPPFTHDLVLIHLNDSIPFSDNVKPVELPVLDETWPDNQNATILGWGASTWLETEDELQKAVIPLYSDEYCVNSDLFNGWILSDPFVMKCGGAINTTFSCNYDYGGPLIYGGKQFGILSYLFPGYVTECGNYLAIYSPVSYFRTWIQQTTGI